MAYCLSCQKEFLNETFCPICKRMLVTQNTFSNEKDGVVTDLTNEYEKDRLIKSQIKEKIQKENATHVPTIKCPYCHSTDTVKISGASRVGSIAFWGIASKKFGKQWHCNNCKSDF